MRMGMSMFMRMVVSNLRAYFHEHAYGDADVNGNVHVNGFPLWFSFALQSLSRANHLTLTLIDLDSL